MIRNHFAIAVGLLLVTAASPSASAQLLTYSPRPLGAYWRFERQPLKGEVQQIEETITRAAGKQQQIRTITFGKLPDGGLQERTTANNNLVTAVNFDTKHRPTLIIAQHTHIVPNGPVVSGVLKEVPTYDANGLKSVELQFNKQPPITCLFAFAPAEENGRVIRWNYANEVKMELTLNADGRITKWDAVAIAPTAKSASYRYTYNTHGDVEKVESADNSSDLFDYVYDDKGNWTERCRTMVRQDVRTEFDTTTRKIQYGPVPAAPEGDPVVVAPTRRPAVALKPQQPPSDEKPADGEIELPAPQAGAERFRSTQGKPGSAIFVENTLVLNPDKTGTSKSTIVFGRDRVNKAAITSWKEEGGTYEITLEKSLDGQEIPKDDKVLKFIKSPQGDLIPEGPGQPFKKLAAEEK